MQGQLTTLILFDSGSEAKEVSPHVLSHTFWYSWILIHPEGNRLKLSACTPAVFEQCFSRISMFEAESLELLWKWEEAERWAYRCLLPQLRPREMGPSLISKRTSFGSFQPHLSTWNSCFLPSRRCCRCRSQSALSTGWPSRLLVNLALANHSERLLDRKRAGVRYWLSLPKKIINMKTTTLCPPNKERSSLSVSKG